MGIFTEIVMSCSMKLDTSAEVLRDIALWCGEIPLDPQGPQLWFYGTFKYENSTSFPGGRYYSLTDCEDGSTVCFSLRANRKNYSREMEEFLAWLAPHSATEGFVGYIHYELEENPKLIFFGDGKAFLREITTYNQSEAHRAERD